MKKKLSLFAKSVHPAHSRQLSERLLSQTFSFYISFVAIGLFLMLAIFVSLNLDRPFNIENLQIENSTVLVDRPLVTINSHLNESSSFIAFSNDKISYNKFIFFGRTEKNYVNELSLLLLPGIVLLIGLISLSFGILLALFSSFIAYLFARKHNTSFRDLLVINLHYQSPALFFFFILFPFWNFSFLVLLLYLFNFIIGVFLLTTKKFKSIEL